MKSIIGALAATILSMPALAQPEVEPKSYDAMGCMLLRECTEDVLEISSIDDVKRIYPKEKFGNVSAEFNSLLAEMRRIGISVYVADEKYFPIRNRGVYHTVSNNFYLNKKYMWDEKQLLETTRHEGWHASQDCMAGSIENNNIAIIFNEEEVPNGYHIRADIAYAFQKAAIPWEREAIWAGDVHYMTVNALRACGRSDKDMWHIYKPTPMTGEWLIENGFWDGKKK